VLIQSLHGAPTDTDPAGAAVAARTTDFAGITPSADRDASRAGHQVLAIETLAPCSGEADDHRSLRYCGGRQQRLAMSPANVAPICGLR